MKQPKKLKRPTAAVSALTTAVKPAVKPASFITSIDDIKDEPTRNYLKKNRLFHSFDTPIGKEEGRLAANLHVANGNPKLRPTNEAKILPGQTSYSPFDNTAYINMKPKTDYQHGDYEAELAHAKQKKKQWYCWYD